MPQKQGWLCGNVVRGVIISDSGIVMRDNLVRGNSNRQVENVIRDVYGFLV